jgi:hypothetical protein
MRPTVLLAAVAAVMLTAPAAAQSAPQTRDDSLAVGRKVITWVYESATDSLWNRFGPQLRQALGSRDGLQEQLDQMMIQLGSETGVVAESLAAKEGNLLYTREANFEMLTNDTGVWRLEIAPDGTIVSGGMQPKSRMQPQPAKPDSAAK